MPPVRVIIVEDEILIAKDIANQLRDLCYDPVGIAGDAKSAISLARQGASIALVDVNLRDGPSGPAIADKYAQDFGLAVIFMTANPDMVRDCTGGALGVVRKPIGEQTVKTVIDYALAARNGGQAEAPDEMTLFAD